MCLALPMRLVKVDGNAGEVVTGQVRRQVRLDLVDQPREGQYLLIHAGFAIEVLDEEEALETLDLVNQAIFGAP